MGLKEKLVGGLAQMMLPGVKSVRGAERVAGKPGLWHIKPSELSDTAWLKNAEAKVSAEADLARNGIRGVPSISGIERAKAADMLLGVLNDINYATKVKSISKPTSEATKGLVYVGKSGDVRGGAVINKAKAADYPIDDALDFTKPSPNYLDYVATTSPEIRGSDMLRTMQELHGPDMVFQVYNPKKNAAIYEAMGAKPMPLGPNGLDVLEGGPTLPAYRIEDFIPPRGPKRFSAEELEALGQQRLEGFSGGGLARATAAALGKRMEATGPGAAKVVRDPDSLRNWIYATKPPENAAHIMREAKGDPEAYLKANAPYDYDKFVVDWLPGKYCNGGLARVGGMHHG